MKKISNEKKLFDLFCDKRVNNKYYSEPFLNAAYNEVWATDGHIVAAVKPELVSGRYQTKTLPLNIPSEKTCDRIITLNAIKDALAKLPIVEEEEVEDVECEECDGSGEVECEYHDNQGSTHEVMADCPICFGTGYVDGTPKKTGEKVVDYDTPIKLDGAYFKGRLFDILAQAMELIGLERLTMTHHGEYGTGVGKACELQADGVRFLLAPMLAEDVHNVIEIEITK